MLDGAVRATRIGGFAFLANPLGLRRPANESGEGMQQASRYPSSVPVCLRLQMRNPSTPMTACLRLTLALIWIYATHERRLVDRNMDPGPVRSGLKRILIGPALYGISMVMCFVSVWISLAIYLIVPLIYIFPGRI